jgi:putative hydrolase of the HAD superfamily
LVDEATEIKDERGVSLSAQLIPGAVELVPELKRRGYRLALVADGPTGTFRNLLTHYQLYHYFDALAISEQVGVEKPHPRMFQYALEQLGIGPENYHRTVMVGNNLARDIKGANGLGIVSVWLDWAPRRPKTPADETEIPRYTIKNPLEFLAVVETLEKLLAIG